MNVLASRRKKTKQDWSHRRLRWTFASPSLIFVLIMTAFPVVFTLVLSLTDARGSVNRSFNFIGFENYTELFSDTDRFWPAVFRTVVFTGGAVGLQVVLGMAIALLLMKPIRGQGLIRTAILLPVVATPVAIGMAWLMIFQPTIGVANEIMRVLGLPEQAWISDPAMALPIIILVDTWQWTPMVALILLAGLVSLPAEPLEAAQIDGANAWQLFFHVILPLVRPALLAAVVLRSIDALKTFDIIYTLKGSGGGSSNEVETLNIYAYTVSFQYADYGVASAVLVVFFVLVMSLAVGLNYVGRRKS